MSGIFDIIRKPFGWLIHWLYSLTGSYLLAILVFSVVLKLVLFPFGIKQQKNSQKQAALRPKENVIRKKYAGRTDRATQVKMSTEIQEMYQKENFSPFGGCLPMIIQMLVLLAVYSVVRMPLTYTANLTEDTVQNIQETVVAMTLEGDGDMNSFVSVYEVKGLNEDGFKDLQKSYLKDGVNAVLEKGSFQTYSEINSAMFIKANEADFEKAYNERFAKEDDKDPGAKVVASIPEFEVFKGFNLGVQPDFSMLTSKLWGEKLLVFIPILNLVISYFGQALTRKFTYQPEQSEEMKNQMRMMSIFMPLFSMFIAFRVPAAVGIYWIMSSALGPVQQIVLSKIFPIKEITPEEMKEAERLYGGKQKQKKKKGNTATGKKKSLVYDDDDEYESVSTVPDKKVMKEKKETDDKKMIEKAPLKDENKD